MDFIANGDAEIRNGPSKSYWYDVSHPAMDDSHFASICNGFWRYLLIPFYPFMFENQIIIFFKYKILLFSLEGLSLAMTKDVFRFVDTYHLFIVLGEVLVGAVIAFFMELTEYLLVSYTSSLTLSVSGIIKVRVLSLVSIL